MAVKEIKAATTKELEREVLALLEQGAIVLTGNPRLVKELFRLHRSRKLGTGEKAWESPEVSSFRFFVDRSYESLWPERRQLSYESSLLLWMEVLRGSGLERDGGQGRRKWRGYKPLQEPTCRRRNAIPGNERL